MQPEVVIYTTPTCTYCAAAKRWFKDHGVQYTEHDVSRDPVRATEMYRLTGQGSVPVIRVGGQVVIGFDPLQLAKLIPTASSGNGHAPDGDSLALRVWRDGEEIEAMVVFPAPQAAAPATAGQAPPDSN
jgi:glutaredoxin-like YruB-family protein